MKQRGISFLDLLGLLFIGLKLTEVIDWSWWLVLLPLYGPLALGLVFMLVMLFVFGIIACIVGCVELYKEADKERRAKAARK